MFELSYIEEFDAVHSGFYIDSSDFINAYIIITFVC